MPKSFTQKATNVLNKSLYLASELGHTYIGSEHILLALTSETDSVAAKLLDTRGVSFDSTRSAIKNRIGCGERTRITPRDMTPRTKRIIENAAYQSTRFSQSYIGTEHLLLAIAAESDSIAVVILSELGVSASDIANDVYNFLGNVNGENTEPRDPSSDKQSRKSQSSLKDSPTINQYGRDLTAMARDGKLDPIIGRETETERVIQILSRRTKNNPCLIGEPGVGKTAVVEGLAQRIAEGTVPETLLGRCIVTLDISSMIAGAKYRGEFEERMKTVMAEAEKNPAVILFIDEIHTIIGAGAAEGAVDAANILKPALARGELQVIGATTISEYRAHIEKDAALERRFQSVMVGEPTPDEAIQILQGLRDRYESHHKVKITDEAINSAVTLSVRYINDRFLPDKAIDLIDEAASKKRIAAHTSPPDLRDAEDKVKALRADKEEAIKSQDFERAASLRDEEKRMSEECEAKKSEWQSTRTTEELSIGEEDIADIVTSWTGIPVKKLADEESSKLLHLEKILKSRIIGQDDAVAAVAKAIRRGRIGLKDPKRPMGSFIFLGPTGVGKTELTKVLADVMFGDTNAMIRVDMSEYMEKHSVSKLIGSPPGYVGYDEGGQLTEKIRRKPYSVVLFDEIEKAHPDVFNILLQILEDGILTDAQGRKVDFKNTIIILTSNVGASGITEQKKQLGFTSVSEAADAAAMRSNVMSSLRETFKPEFLNRIDEIIIFNKLTSEDIKKIAAVMLDEVKARIEGLGVNIRFDDTLVESLAHEGFDPVWGARPLRRAIQRRIEDSFATAMLDESIHSGDSVNAIIGNNGAIEYQKDNV
ncbi:MAG: ATP-dependent Clp protease ATP-binding subunit [Clostridiales bacterium]|nr:ATP-dependent Clp protease ATP-binding subunit [Clostridiales bacterium]